MIWFWIVAGAVSLGVGLWLAAGMRRAPGADDHARDLAIYKDQLREIERDLARGVVAEEEAARLRLEVERRILAADKIARPEGEARRARWPMVALAVVPVIAGAGAIYLWIGAPGYGDLPLTVREEMLMEAAAGRPSQAVAMQEAARQRPDRPVSPERQALIVQLRDAVGRRPDDLRGLELLARNEAILGNFDAGIAAQQRIIEVKGAEATAGDFTDLAELLIVAAGGYVSPEAEAVLDAALARDRREPTARYYRGLMLTQIGRPDMAFDVWRPLLDEGGPDAPWQTPIRERIEIVAQAAGVLRFEVPPRPAGPSAADVAAAEDLSEDDRNAMIAGMVSRLSERLATEGGSAQDWGRLIVARSVLGQRDQAAAILAEARQVFEGRDELQAVLDAAAAQAGLDG
ncbi:MAG: c-type cytochrome biogenesis protein CcmI [Shimia sp.]